MLFGLLSTFQSDLQPMYKFLFIPNLLHYLFTKINRNRYQSFYTSYMHAYTSIPRSQILRGLGVFSSGF